jgi:hypothetical protein
MSQINVGRVSASEGVSMPEFTSSTRPTNPAPNSIIYNSTIKNFELWDGTQWVVIGSSQAQQGTISQITGIGGDIVYKNGYKYHIFTGDSTFTVTNTPTATPVEVLLVGGGGAGGFYVGGGGGAGGFVETTVNVSNNSYTISVGAGGTAGYNLRPAGSGLPTTAFGLIAYGGGGGASYSDGQGASGGSGGGAGGPGGGGVARAQGTSGQGNAGGTSLRARSGTPTNGSGGGGAGAQGYDEQAGGSTHAPNGGDGLKSTVCPDGYFYAGGGGGGMYNSSSFGNAGSGGRGGGGGGGTSSTSGAIGHGGGGRNRGELGISQDPGGGGRGGLNTGGGGGGAGHFATNPDRANGGSGIVIIKYQVF